MANKRVRKAAEATALAERPKAEVKAVKAAEASIYSGGKDLTYAGNFIPAASNNGPIQSVNWHRAAQWTMRQFDQNATAHRALEIITDHVHGLGLKHDVKAQDNTLKDLEESMLAVGDKLFNGKMNKLNLKLRQRILESCTIGEAAFTVEENPANGEVRVGYIDPRGIKEVELDAFDRSEVSAIVVQEAEWRNYKYKGEERGKMYFNGEPRRLKTLAYDWNPFLRDEKGKVMTAIDPETQLQRERPNPNCGKLSGEVLYIRNPNLPAEPRGRSDIHHVVEWLQWIDNGVNDFLRRLDVQGAVVMDILWRGLEEADLKLKANDFRLPTGRIPWHHNEQVELKMQSPNIKVEELTGFLRTLIVLAAGSIGIPEFALGDGSQTNVATAAEQMPTLYAKFDNRRTFWEAHLALLYRYALERANDRGMLYRTVTNKDPKAGAEVKSKGETVKLTTDQLDTFDILCQLLPYEKNLAKEAASMLKDVGDSLLGAEGAEYVSKRTAAKTFRTLLSKFGIDIDDVAEDVQIQDEKLTAGKGTSLTGANVSMQDVAK